MAGRGAPQVMPRRRSWDVWLDVAFCDDATFDVDELLASLSLHSPVVSVHRGTLGIGVTVCAGDPIKAGRAAATAAAAAFEAVGFDSAYMIERVEIVEEDRAARDLDEPTFPELLGALELAAMLGVSRQRVHELRQAERLPEPLTVLASGPVWTRPSIDRFVESWIRRPGRPKIV